MQLVEWHHLPQQLSCRPDSRCLSVDAQLPDDDGYYDYTLDPFERAIEYKFKQALAECALPGDSADVDQCCVVKCCREAETFTI